MPILPTLVSGLIFGLILLIFFMRTERAHLEVSKKNQELEKKLTETEIELGRVHEQERLNLLKRDTLLEILLRQLNMAVLATDQRGQINFINDATIRLFRRTESEFMGTPIQLLPLISESGRSPVNFESVFQGKIFNFPTHMKLNLNSEKIPVSGSLFPLKNSKQEIVGAAGVFYDARPSLTAETEIKTFFSTAAHELRTPLTIIRSSLSLILENYDKFDSRKLKELLLITNQSVEHLFDLVNDFLNVSRMELGRLEVKKEKIDMISLTKEVLAEYLRLTHEKQLHLTHDLSNQDLPKATGDRAKTKEILINLVSNAVKYTHQGGVTVSHQVEDNHIATVVTDTGVGIANQNQTLLFKPFQQVGTARGQETNRSTGLGLYIAKNMATLMGGDVILESSEPGKGSVFKFWLPIAANP